MRVPTSKFWEDRIQPVTGHAEFVEFLDILEQVSSGRLAALFGVQGRGQGWEYKGEGNESHA